MVASRASLHGNDTAVEVDIGSRGHQEERWHLCLKVGSSADSETMCLGDLGIYPNLPASHSGKMGQFMCLDLLPKA